MTLGTESLSGSSGAMRRRILCPVDFSPTSARAAAYAERLARELRADLILLHAFDTPESLTMAGQTRPANPDLRNQLAAIGPTSDDRLTVDRQLHAGDPGPVICWLAEHRHCDLIVLGTHGRTGLRHLLLGSVAEYVMRHARCPVLSIRDRPDNEPPLEEPLVLPPPPPRWM